MQKIYKFVDNFKFYIFVPLAFMLIGVLFNIFGGVNLSIDFRGGTSISYSYDGKISTDKVKKTVEKSLSEAGNETVVTFSYTGDLAASDVDTALKDLIDGISFSSETSTQNNKSLLKVTAVGKTLLTDANVKSITSKLNESYSSNKITYNSKTNAKYADISVDVTTTRDYTSGTSSVVISVVGNHSVSTAQLEQIKTDLTTNYKSNNLELASVNTVDATLGSGFFAKSLYAVVLASILVVLYVGYRFRKVGGFKAGLTALVALVHDLLFVYFTDVIFGLDIDTNFIAVVLTILGYSLNDTIVIYDRIRENTILYGNKKSTREFVNMAISQSIKRSIVTSVTTFVAIFTVTIVASIAGLDSILSFSIPMSVGVIAGSFSSICIAGPLYVFWCEHNDKKGKHKKDKIKKDMDNGVVDYTNKINPKNSKKRVY